MPGAVRMAFFWGALTSGLMVTSVARVNSAGRGPLSSSTSLWVHEYSLRAMNSAARIHREEVDWACVTLRGAPPRRC